MDNFLVFYSEGCSPHIAVFPTEKDAKAFVKSFKLKHKNNKEDNWIDLTVKGELLKISKDSGVSIKYYL